MREMNEIKIKNAKLNYVDIGSGFPLLFLHAYLLDHKMWLPQIKLMSQSYRCIVPDLWGHGLSEALPSSSQTLFQIADDMMILMRSLGLDEFGVIGASLGGMTAAALAYSHPLSVKFIGLMSTLLGGEFRDQKTDILSILNPKGNGAYSEEQVIEELSTYLLGSQQTENSLLNHGYGNQISAKICDVKSLMHLSKLLFERSHRVNLLDALSEINIPTLVILGEQDIYCSRENSALLRNRIVNARVAVLPQAGHTTSLDQPIQVSMLLNLFAASHAASIA